MTKDKPTISIIISNFNGEKFLKRCLYSILAEGEKPFEIVVIENGSTDDSVTLLKKEFGNTDKIKLIFLEKNVGPARGRNIGIKNSSGNYIFFLDNDTKIKQGWFEETVRFFDTYKKAGLVQVKLLSMGTNRFDSAGELISPLGFLVERARSAEDTGQFDQADPIFGLKTAGAIVRREVIDKIKGFDEDYYIYWEDTDFAWRTWLAGFEVLFAPTIVVWHAYGTSEKKPHYERYKKFYRVTYFGCRNMTTTLIKNLGLKKLACILPANIACWLTLALFFLARLKPEKSFAILKSVLWNLAHLPKILQKRKVVQTTRKISDQELFALVGTKRSISYYIGKGLAYLTGRPF